MKKTINEVPTVIKQNILFVLFLIMIVMLGYIDYVTSDYSLILFYIIYIVGLSWYTNISYGITGAFMATFAEVISDYYTHYDAVFQPLYYWNWCNDLIIFIIISLSDLLLLAL